MYTKGEWLPYQLKSNNVSVCVKTEGDSVAVEIASLNTLLGYDTVVANANLIAAAPDLYEACKEARRNIDLTGYVTVVTIVNFIDKALAKAEGK